MYYFEIDGHMVTKEAIVNYLQKEGGTRQPETVAAGIGASESEVLDCVMELARSGDRTIRYGCGVLGLR